MSPSPFSRPKRLFVAIVSVAVLAIGFAAPVASADTIKPTDNSGTVADGETRADPAQCKQYKVWYDDDVKAGNQKSADYYKNLADRRGCRWAERIVGPTTQPGTVTTEPIGINPGPVSSGTLVDSGSVTTSITVMP
jgi:hypothetical protein